MLEVEMKFRVVDPHALEERLQGMGLRFEPEVEERDKFYQHPCRDFGKTDEGLRLRLRKFGDGTVESFLTYKGPKLDPTTKTRREIEIPVDPEAPWPALLESLGFREAGTVHKFRRRSELQYEGRLFDVLLDRLPALPDAYAEIETLVDEDAPGEPSRSRTLLLACAQTLSLTESVRTSYFALILGLSEGEG